MKNLNKNKYFIKLIKKMSGVRCQVLSVSRGGFTILELLLVVSLIGLIMAFSMVINYSFYINNDIDVAT
jgi:prepilin-type N-terminal cleavage/methylation domain-containing protein